MAVAVRVGIAEPTQITDPAPGLLDRVGVENSPSGGWHVVYVCADPVCGNF